MFPVLVVLQLGQGGGVMHAEEVSVSRYRLTVQASSTPGEVRTAVQDSVLNALCRDDDGCAVVLVSDVGGARIVANARLLLSPTQASLWSTSDQPNNVLTDGDDNEEVVVGIVTDGECSFRDADAATGTDDALGFSVTAKSIGFTIVCKLTLID
jgi:hypothetical protein